MYVRTFAFVVLVCLLSITSVAVGGSNCVPHDVRSTPADASDDVVLCQMDTWLHVEPERAGGSPPGLTTMPYVYPAPPEGSVRDGNGGVRAVPHHLGHPVVFGGGAPFLRSPIETIVVDLYLVAPPGGAAAFQQETYLLIQGSLPGLFRDLPVTTVALEPVPDNPHLRVLRFAITGVYRELERVGAPVDGSWSPSIRIHVRAVDEPSGAVVAYVFDATEFPAAVRVNVPASELGGYARIAAS